jgi:hypothetical protein
VRNTVVENGDAGIRVLRRAGPKLAGNVIARNRVGVATDQVDFPRPWSASDSLVKENRGANFEGQVPGASAATRSLAFLSEADLVLAGERGGPDPGLGWPGPSGRTTQLVPALPAPPESGLPGSPSAPASPAVPITPAAPASPAVPVSPAVPASEPASGSSPATASAQPG